MGEAVVRSAIVEDVEVGDAGVLEDIDTPEDYRRLVAPDRRAE